jgi:hypothetical protein
MGNESVAARTAELLSFNGHYAVPGDNQADRLLDDVGCFMASALAMLRKELEIADSPEINAVEPELAARLWGIYHLLQMAQGAANAANASLPNSQN